MTETAVRFQVHITPGDQTIGVAPNENVLAAALAAGIPLPHSCRAGRCASCKARLLAGVIAYPGDRLPPGVVAAEAARGEVLLCQAQPRSDLRLETRLRDTAVKPASGVVVQRTEPLATGGHRVSLRLLGSAELRVRAGQFINVETANAEAERVPVVAATLNQVDVEVRELAPDALVRARGPFDSPR